MFVTLCLVAGIATGTREATDLELATGESGRAEAIRADGDFPDPAVENILVTARSGTLDQPAATRAATAAADRLGRLPEVAAVGDPVPAPALSAPMDLAELALRHLTRPSWEAYPRAAPWPMALEQLALVLAA